MGIIVPDIRNPFFPSIMDAIKNYVIGKNYEIFVSSTEESISEQERIIESFLQYHVAGAIVVSARSNKRAAEMLMELNERSPIVLIDRNVPGLSCPKVLLRNVAASKQLVDHLLSLGHRRIAAVVPPKWISIGQERAKGYYASLKEAGIACTAEYIFVGKMFEDTGEQAADYFAEMDCKSRPTAIMSCSDVVTIGLLRGFLRRSIRVPDDISLVSFDDPDYFPVLSPPITCIAQPTDMFGIKAAELLISSVENSSHISETIMLDGTLNIRESTRRIE